MTNYEGSLIEKLEAERRTQIGNEVTSVFNLGLDVAISIVRQHEAERVIKTHTSREHVKKMAENEHMEDASNRKDEGSPEALGKASEADKLTSSATQNKIEIADISDDDPVGDAYADGYTDGYKAKAIAAEKESRYSATQYNPEMVKKILAAAKLPSGAPSMTCEQFDKWIDDIFGEHQEGQVSVSPALGNKTAKI